MSETRMNCPEYRDALAEAALAGAVDAPLRSHLTECDACRKEFERLSALAAAMDHGVAEMVSGEPGPGFAARVRARIAQDAEQSAAWWRGWVPALAGGVAVLALVAWLMWSGGWSPANSEAPTTAQGTEPAVTPKTTPAQTPLAQPTPTQIPEPERVERASAPRRSPTRTVASASTPKREAPALPEVLVTGDEWAQVVKLYELSQRGQADLGPMEVTNQTPLEERAQPLIIAQLDPIKPVVEEAAAPPPAQ